MKTRLIFILLFTALLPSGLWALTAAGGIGAWGQNTITTALLKVQYDKLSAAANKYGMASAVTTMKVTVLGRAYTMVPPGSFDYATLFKKSGGPTMRSVGINFTFLEGYDVGSDGTSGNAPTFTNGIFLIFNGFLALMIGFRWMGIMGEVSKGKGGLEITPLILKLMMGLVVVYNMPFVYAIAMQLKDLGETIVLCMIAPNSNNTGVNQAAKNLANASPKNIATRGVRDQGIIAAVNKIMTQYAYAIVNVPATPGSTPTPQQQQQTAINSGRARLAVLVAALNSAMNSFPCGTLSAVTIDDSQDPPVVGATTPLGNASQWTNLINYVGFPFGMTSASSPNYIVNYASDPTAANSTYPKLNWSDATTYSSSGSPILTYANNTASGQALLGMYNSRLATYLRLMANTYSSGNIVAAWENGQNENDIFQGSSGGTAPNSTCLGDNLLTLDQTYCALNDPSTSDTTDYIGQVRDQTLAWFQTNVMGSSQTTNLKGTIPTGQTATSTVEQGSGESTMGNIFKVLVNLPRLFADLAISIVKSFWIPFVAWMADSIFNFTIECYVYLLMLAYPFWFYKKTEKAFSGAMDTLISVAFTALTFNVLTMMFEGFIGQVEDWITFQSTGGKIAGAAVTVAHFFPPTAAFAWGREVGIAIGFAIMYMVGTAVCLVLAPKIFKAFKEGSSVVAPMIMGAVSALAAGAVGAVLMGGAATAGIGKLAGSATGKAVGGAAKGALNKAGQGLSKVGQGLNRLTGGYAGKALTGVKNAASAVQGIGSSAISRMGAVASKLPGAQTAQNIGAGMKDDYTNSIVPKLKEIAADPRQAFLRLADSSAGRTFVAAAAAVSGDPTNVLKGMGAQTFTDMVANRGAPQPKKLSAVVKNAPISIDEPAPSPILGPDGKPAKRS